METTTSRSASSKSGLAELQCEACSGEQPRLEGSDATDHLHELPGGWQIVDGHHLRKSFEFANFAQAMSFTNKVGMMAEANNHHPELRLSWGRLEVLIWTHAVDGLTRSDFILAAKIEQIE